MMTQFACPVCKEEDWGTVERFLYHRKDSERIGVSRLGSAWRRIAMLTRVVFLARPRSRLVSCQVLNNYQKCRREVLFNVWFPNRTIVSLESIRCSTCGFMAYSPRPTEDDVFQKYQYLKHVEPDIGGQSSDAYAINLDTHRAQRIYSLFSKYLTKANADILDYGGGNGKLMLPFLHAGHKCSIADYNGKPIEGVKKVGNDLSEIETSKQYDFIICSHVLEHVSDFPHLILGLRALLKPWGMIYAEVPQEIWGGTRIECDPVTHINFFTQNSFLRTFMRNGFEILEHRQQISSYGPAHMEVIWLLAKNGDECTKVDLPSDVDALLYPSRISSLRKIGLVFLAPMLRKFGRRFLMKR